MNANRRRKEARGNREMGNKAVTIVNLHDFLETVYMNPIILPHKYTAKEKNNHQIEIA